MGTRISGMTAVLAANLDDTALFEVTDKNSATRKATVAQLRTAIAAGAIAFLSTVGVAGNLTVGASTFVVTAATGQTTISGSGTNIVIKDTQAYSGGAPIPGLSFQGLDSGSTNIQFGSIVGRPNVGNADRGFLVFATRVNGVNTTTLTLGTGLALDSTFAGPLAITGALTGVTTAALSEYIEGTEMAAPAAPAANKGRIFFQDNGAGKTQLMCLFASGAAQQLAIEP